MVDKHALICETKDRDLTDGRRVSANVGLRVSSEDT
jgi:hypothetical protein